MSIQEVVRTVQALGMLIDLIYSMCFTHHHAESGLDVVFDKNVFCSKCFILFYETYQHSNVDKKE